MTNAVDLHSGGEMQRLLKNKVAYGIVGQSDGQNYGGFHIGTQVAN